MGGIRVQISNGRLDPIRPAALANIITTQEWATLGYQIGDALASTAVFFNQLVVVCQFVTVVGFVVGFAMVVFSMMDAYGDSAWLPLGFLVCFMTVLLSILCQCGLSVGRYCCVETSTQAAISKVLQDFAQQQSKNGLLVTAHLLQDGSAYLAYHGGRYVQRRQLFIPEDYVLEFSVQPTHGDGYNVGEATSYRLASSNGTMEAFAATCHRDVRGRLQALEDLRDVLRPEEYEERRKMILNDV